MQQLMNRVAGVLLAIAVSSTSVPATGGGLFIEETNPKIDIRIAIDPTASSHPGLLEILHEDASALAAKQRQLAAEDHTERGGEPSWNPHQLDAAYEVTFFNGKIASVVSKRDTYTGGAHGNQDFVTMLLDLEGGRRINPEGLFVDFSPGSEAFEAIQAYVRDSISFERASRLGLPEIPPEDLDWILEGTATPEQLLRFTLMDYDEAEKVSDILMYFPPYQVGSYAEGSYMLDVPALVFADYLAPEFRPLFDDGQ